MPATKKSQTFLVLCAILTYLDGDMSCRGEPGLIQLRLLDTETREIGVEASLVDTAASKVRKFPDADAGSRPALSWTANPAWIILSGSLHNSCHFLSVRCQKQCWTQRDMSWCVISERPSIRTSVYLAFCRLLESLSFMLPCSDCKSIIDMCKRTGDLHQICIYLCF